jgi:hypothetical protein
MKLFSPSFAVAVTALVVALGGSAIAQVAVSDSPETVRNMRGTPDGQVIGTDNDGTVKKAGVGIYDITFNTGAAGGKLPLDLERCAIVATPRVETASKPEEVAADVDVQRLSGARIFVESTRLLPFGENKITPFLTNVSFDVAAIC